MILFIILAYIGYRILKGFLATQKISPPEARPADDTVKDPVCGVYLTREDAVIGTVEGERIYFCSMNCLEKYRDQIHSKEKEAIRP